MKQCPVCEKEFDDSLRFCQVDGTPLVDKSEAEDVDPFKTMVARKEDIAAAIPASPSPPPPPEPSVPAPIESELLEIPPAASDPNKTQFVSEEELRAEMAKHQAEDQVIDVPPIVEPEAPKFVEPEAPASPFGGAPPPSPFSTPNEPAAEEPGPANFPTSPPIPSPFSTPPEVQDQAVEEQVKEEEFVPSSPFAEPVSPEPAAGAFNAPISAPIAQAEVSSPVVPETNMQNPQNFGQGAPAAAGPNQTLAIVSLVVGILSLCCGYTFVVPIIAIVLGLMARGKANNDPSNYGGAGLALGGIITGAVALLLGIVVIILNVVMGFGGAMMQNF